MTFGKKVILFGVGNGIKKISEYLINNCDDVLMIVDNDEKKWGGEDWRL